MQQTLAKALVRSYFYREFLPAHLSDILLRGSNYLVLLGDSGEEEKLLTQLGVAPWRVYCVENDPGVYDVLSQRARKGGYDCTRYLGELADFIAYNLRMNQRFGVLDLDIYGSYMNHIDPVMTDVLLFARRNPRTVVATYSNGGRDRTQLREGLRSWVTLHWLAPDATAKAVQELYGRYRDAGRSIEVSVNMVLRHLFWLRSNLENALRSAVAVGATKTAAAQRFLDSAEEAWQQFAANAPKTLKLRDITARTQKLRKFQGKAKLVDLGIADLSIATYEAAHGFYHIGWFALYKRIEPLTVQEWLEVSLKQLVSQPLQFADGSSDDLRQLTGAGEELLPGQVVWKSKDLRRAQRKVRLPLLSLELQNLEEAPASDLTFTEEETEEAEETSISDLTSAEEVTEEVDLVPLIKQLASEGLNTAQIVEQLPGPHPKNSIQAYVAVSRRKKS
jgi:hypothetical protein